MALDNFTRGSGGGGFVKVTDHVNDLAILVEVESYDPAAPNPFAGPNSPESEQTRPAVVATFSFFEDQAALDDGDPVVEESATLAGYAALTRDLGANVGKTLLLRLGERTGKQSGRATRVWEPITDKAIISKVEEYLASLEEAPV
ncbi:hypothetical protein EMG21_28930 [Klebsiella pneumoniae]|nr:hypothetical protein EMG21_28930 [Klebsiella pneumoniae]